MDIPDGVLDAICGEMEQHNRKLCIDEQNDKPSVEQHIGVKYDADKPRMELLPFDALIEVAKVLTYGAKKYAPDNWKIVPDAKERYTGALLRHLAAWREGEVFDKEVPDGNIRHIAQVATNAIFLIWFELQEEKDGDDNKQGVSGKSNGGKDNE